MARCSSCLSNADVPLDDIGAGAFARSLNRAQIRKKSLRPFAQRSSRLKFRAPRPDRRARSCRDASVSVDPPRVRLFVKGCGMSEAELGGIPGVVRGALPRKAGECPHAAGRKSNASAKSSNARVIYLLRQTASADRAKRIFARCAPSRWLASTLTRRALSPVPSSPSLHGAPRLGRLNEPTGAPPFIIQKRKEKRAIDTCVSPQENRFSGRLKSLCVSVKESFRTALTLIHRPPTFDEIQFGSFSLAFQATIIGWSLLCAGESSSGETRP